MSTIFLTLYLALQGISVPPGQSGTITGTLRTSDGKPASGVRISAVVKPEQPASAVSKATIASLAETSESGQFRLENIPPGRYYIAAGRLDRQTFYPGAVERSGAQEIQVIRGETISNLDFVLRSESEGRITGFSVGVFADLPLKVIVNGNGRVPVFSPAGFARLVLVPTRDGSRTFAYLDQKSVTLSQSPSFGSSAEYRVSIENLPEGYSLKSITSGTVNLSGNTLQLPATIFGAITTATQVSSSLGNQTTTTRPPLASQYPISVVLDYFPPTKQTSGVRVSGQSTSFNGPQSLYLSRIPGTLYADGTFEFADVSPGPHFIWTVEVPNGKKRLLGAYIYVGKENLSGIQLEEIPVLPANSSTSSQRAADNLQPGNIRLASLRGHVIEETTRQAIKEGIVYFSGGERISLRLDSNGNFEFPHVLPGDYKLELQTFGYLNSSQAISVGDADIQLEISTRRFE